MKQIILRLSICILVLTIIGGYCFENTVSAASSCTVETHSVPVGTGTLFYNQVGTGQTILLLHGLFAEKEQWDSMMCQLSEAGYQAIAPDLPGYGNSKGFIVKDYALENQVTLLHQWIDQVGVQSLDITGSSMGGAIAALYAQRYPNQVRSLALIGSPLGVIDWANPVKNSILNGVNPFIPITKEQFDLEMSLLFVTPPSISNSVKTEKVRDYRTRNRHYQQVWDIVNLYEEVLCQNLSLQRPTLVIWGKQDQIYDIQGADRLQRCLPGSEMIQLPEAGHLLLIENAAEVASDYIHFLQTIRSQ
ncbi:MAG TPA: alpha/beta hydrolase [Coleofasciculaceae cyanobacterium]|jgi:pimeloyl-ACP methyl ester carboxylesterase